MAVKATTLGGVEPVVYWTTLVTLVSYVTIYVMKKNLSEHICNPKSPEDDKLMGACKPAKWKQLEMGYARV